MKTYTGDAWQAHSVATGELLMQHQVGPADVRNCAICDDVAWQPLVQCWQLLAACWAKILEIYHAGERSPVTTTT